jgi:hypothetical protein
LRPLSIAPGPAGSAFGRGVRGLSRPVRGDRAIVRSCCAMVHSQSGDRWFPTRLTSSRSANAIAYVTLLTALAAVVYGHHVLFGGFAWDDWENAATTSLRYGDGFIGPFDVRQAIYEPGLSAALPLPHLVFGLRPAWHLGLAVVLGVAMSLCTWKLLQELEVPIVPAALVGALSLVFPWSDSTRLWATAGVNQVAVCLFLAGATHGARALKLAGPPAARSARKGLALTTASVLTYPVTVLAVVAMPALYRFLTPWSRAWRAGLPATLVGLAGLAYVSLTTTKPVLPLGDQIAHVPAIVAEWGALLAMSTALPERLPTGCLGVDRDHDVARAAHRSTASGPA